MDVGRDIDMTQLGNITADMTPESDALLVRDALASGSETDINAAVAEIYDRYSDRIYTMCSHMLGDSEEAADATASVFLVALERLNQLREPEKLRPWLHAIARNEVYKRSRRRSRVTPIAEVQDMSDVLSRPDSLHTPAVDATAEIPAVDNAALASLLQTAAGGLDSRDRMVLELNMSQGLDGEDLAEALGVKVDNAYQMTHRMRERLERSMSALLVVSAGRDVCSDLDGVAKKWDGDYDVLWRKRFSRHVDKCPNCQKMRSKLPKAMLAGAVLSQAAQSAVMAAPISIRQQVVTQGSSLVGSSSARAWSSNGFPKAAKRSRRGLFLVAAGVFVATFLVLALAGTVAQDRIGLFDEGDPIVIVETPPTTIVGNPPVIDTGDGDVVIIEEDPDDVGDPGDDTTTDPDGTTTVPEEDDPVEEDPVTPDPDTDPKYPDNDYPGLSVPSLSLPPLEIFLPSSTIPSIK